MAAHASRCASLHVPFPWAADAFIPSAPSRHRDAHHDERALVRGCASTCSRVHTAAPRCRKPCRGARLDVVNHVYFTHARQGSWDEGAKVDLRRFPECNWTDWRLPASARPDHYELELFAPMQVRCMARSQTGASDILKKQGAHYERPQACGMALHACWRWDHVITP